METSAAESALVDGPQTGQLQTGQLQTGQMMPGQMMPGQILARGVCRLIAASGDACLTEVALANGRRADVMVLGRDGGITIIEVKSSIADFRSDRKWPAYRDYCDELLFAVPAGFPQALIPEDCGLILADPFGAAILRPGHRHPLAAARRKTVTLRFARLAAARLLRLTDPQALAGGEL